MCCSDSAAADGGHMSVRPVPAWRAAEARPAPQSPDWWRTAVVYQIYLRSFADGNGDGIGDLAGLRARLPYLVWLGVDALWINPHYPSGGADGGYDVIDHRAAHPHYGLPRRRPALRGGGPPRGVGGRRPPRRPARRPRRRAEPHLRPAPVVPGGARR